MEKRIAARFGIWLVTLVLSAMVQGSAARADEISEILRGYQIISEIFPKGTKLNFAGTDWALVGLGSYLVNSTGCNDCHTHPNWTATGNPYLGQPKRINIPEYMAGGRVFSPTVTSANITPDKRGRPAGLTLQEFLYALQTGHDPKDGDILQVMPWPLYQWKTERELTAMYEYLRVIPSLPNNPNPGS
jgi:hypothetical protein